MSLIAWEKNFTVWSQCQPPFALNFLAERALFSTGTWGRKGPGQVCVPSCSQLLLSASAPLHPMARMYRQTKEKDREQ